MLVTHLREYPSRPWRVEPCNPDESAQLSQHRVQNRKLRRFHNSKVKLLVEVEERILVAVPCRSTLADNREAQEVDVVIGDHVAGAPYCNSLERLAQHCDFLAM